MDGGDRLADADVYDGSLPARLKPATGGLLLRATLLFSAALVALALVVVPMADRRTHDVAASGGPELDMMATGSIGTSTQHYTVRRSVLQAPGSAPCLLFSDGTSRGGC
ncbi:hypothetical protein [Aurantimonas sp. 22II-16-19i]|uniref:hypothetical protein n=1 Tax=Aurantimonas sp. 22II-16-19i TaxID=1317114 RepID=UPI0009F7FD87|nr:hypothetical protein [Aurantimonas sp. 22II-16-19i]ORE97695.1 hypothetical protein ATO4_07145 [Aurantimonas sp. 22II-16-19i]